jgi:hypothetical protein
MTRYLRGNVFCIPGRKRFSALRFIQHTLKHLRIQTHATYCCQQAFTDRRTDRSHAAAVLAADTRRQRAAVAERVGQHGVDRPLSRRSRADGEREREPGAVLHARAGVRHQHGQHTAGRSGGWREEYRSGQTRRRHQRRLLHRAVAGGGDIRLPVHATDSRRHGHTGRCSAVCDCVHAHHLPGAAVDVLLQFPDDDAARRRRFAHAVPVHAAVGRARHRAEPAADLWHRPIPETRHRRLGHRDADRANRCLGGTDRLDVPAQAFSLPASWRAALSETGSRDIARWC